MALAQQADARRVVPRVGVAARGCVGARERACRRILWALLGVTAVKQLALALLYPPFQGHDEVAHLGYVRVVATQGRLPTLFDSLPNAWAAWSRYTLDWPALYTANHPPLYYVLAAPLYRLAGSDPLTQLYAVRLLAVPLFLAVVWLAAALARVLFPADDFLALTVPAVIAFQPQLSFEGAIVNNDILAILLGALLLYELALTLRDGLTRERAALLGVTQGVALLTKASLLAFAPLIVAVALWRAWPLRRTLAARWRATLPIAGWLVAPAVLLPLPWYLFVRRTYGDFTAFHALDQLQAAWGPPVGSVWAQLTSWSLESARLRESWGEFGWKLMPLSSAEWRAALAATLLCGAGLLVGAARYGWAWRRARRAPGAAWQRAGVVLLLGACLLLYGGVLYFGARFPLTQARYAFPAAPAAALLAMLGLRALLPARGRDQAAACVIALAAAFQVLLLTRLVLPYGLS